MTADRNLSDLGATFLKDSSLLQLDQSSNDYQRKTQRRTMLFVSSSPDEALMELKATDKQSFDEIVELVAAYRQHLKMLSDMTEQALNRLSSIKNTNYSVDATR